MIAMQSGNREEEGNPETFHMCSVSCMANVYLILLYLSDMHVFARESKVFFICLCIESRGKLWPSKKTVAIGPICDIRFLLKELRISSETLCTHMFSCAFEKYLLLTFIPSTLPLEQHQELLWQS